MHTRVQGATRSKLADFRELYGSLAGTLAHVFSDVHLHNSSNNTMGQPAGQNAISASREIGPIFDFFIFHTNFRELHGYVAVVGFHVFPDAHLYNL